MSTIPHTNDALTPEWLWEPNWECHCDACNNYYADLADHLAEQRIDDPPRPADRRRY